MPPAAVAMVCFRGDVPCTGALDHADASKAAGSYTRPWQCLNFLPEPQGQDALRETLPQVAGSLGSTLGLVRGRCSVATPPPDGSAGSKPGSSACRAASAGSSWISRICAGAGTGSSGG